MLLITASFLGIPVQYLIQFHALSLTTVSHAALMVGTMPVILAIGATIFTHERLGWTGWLALAGSTCGVTLITLSGTQAQARPRRAIAQGRPAGGRVADPGSWVDPAEPAPDAGALPSSLA